MILQLPSAAGAVFVFVRLPGRIRAANIHLVGDFDGDSLSVPLVHQPGRH